MAPLANSLALLAMVTATVAIKVVTLDMANNSFDDQYQGCHLAMTEALPGLNRSEFQKNPFFAQAWRQAMAEWQRLGSPVSPLSSQEQAIAIMAFMMNDCLYDMFNDAVLEAGSSPQEYRGNFHYKTLHFLLTDALATLRDTQKGQCLDVFQRECGVCFEAKPGDTVRFGEFMTMWLRKTTGSGCSEGTEFQVHTCHGAEIQSFPKYLGYQFVLIPPFETFEVTEVIQEGNKSQIWLSSSGTSSKYNCEWLKGDPTGAIWDDGDTHCGHGDTHDKAQDTMALT